MLTNERKYLRFTLTFIITILIFIFLFHKASFIRCMAIVNNANLKIIFLTLVISVFSNILISANRWKLILEHLGCSITFKESLLVKMGSDSIINILPLRSGELLRVLYLKRLKDFSYSKSFFSIISEYLLNILVLVLSVFAGGIVYAYRNNNFDIISMVCILAPLSPVVLFLLLRSSLFGDLNKNFLGKFNLFVDMYIKEFVGVLKKPVIIFFSSIFVLTGIINAFLLARALGISLPLDSILIFIPIVTLAGNIPLTIGGLGARESATIFFFLKFASTEMLLSFGILYSFVEYIFPLVVGLFMTGTFLNRTFFYK